jgi:hypothetical protein
MVGHDETIGVPDRPLKNGSSTNTMESVVGSNNAAVPAIGATPISIASWNGYGRWPLVMSEE